MAASPVQIFVEALDDYTKIQIIQDYTYLERDGFIGDSAIRIEAEKLMKYCHSTSSQSILWMDAIAKECYRYFAMKYISEHFDQ